MCFTSGIITTVKLAILNKPNSPHIFFSYSSLIKKNKKEKEKRKRNEQTQRPTPHCSFRKKKIKTVKDKPGTIITQYCRSINPNSKKLQTR